MSRKIFSQKIALRLLEIHNIKSLVVYYIHIVTQMYSATRARYQIEDIFALGLKFEYKNLILEHHTQDILELYKFALFM